MLPGWLVACEIDSVAFEDSLDQLVSPKARLLQSEFARVQLLTGGIALAHCRSNRPLCLVNRALARVVALPQLLLCTADLLLLANLLLKKERRLLGGSPQVPAALACSPYLVAPS